MLMIIWVIFLVLLSLMKNNLEWVKFLMTPKSLPEVSTMDWLTSTTWIIRSKPSGPSKPGLRSFRKEPVGLWCLGLIRVHEGLLRCRVAGMFRRSRHSRASDGKLSNRKGEQQGTSSCLLIRICCVSMYVYIYIERERGSFISLCAEIFKSMPI